MIEGDVLDDASRVERIAETIAAAHAADVDCRARFPVEVFDALRAEGVLAAGIPVAYGGGGRSLREQAAMCQQLGRYCSASAMTLAMHFIQVEVLVDEATQSEAIAAYLRTVVTEKRLIASATSEVGTRDMRASRCHVDRTGDGIGVTKQCATVSYGAFADDILFQARTGSDAAPSHQCMVLAVRDTYTLRTEGTWDVLGMRGTCSPGGVLEVRGDEWQVLSTPFVQIMNRVMVPATHILWGAVWLGIAQAAEAKANGAVRAAARSNPGEVPSTAGAMGRLGRDIQVMRASIEDLLTVMEDVEDRSDLETVELMLEFNNLKVLTSQAVVRIVQRAMRICGIKAYRNDSPQSLTRELRDAHSAELMVSNYTICASNEALLLVHKPSMRGRG